MYMGPIFQLVFLGIVCLVLVKFRTDHLYQTQFVGEQKC